MTGDGANRGRRRPSRWEVELYERADGVQPAEVFFQSIEDEVAQRLIGYIDHVAEDPVGYPAGAEWQAMHGEALGCHEVRVRSRNRLYRIYVKLDTGPFAEYPDAGRLVLLTGESKPVRTALPPSVYRAVGQMANDYMQDRRVSPAT